MACVAREARGCEMTVAAKAMAVWNIDATRMVICLQVCRDDGLFLNVCQETWELSSQGGICESGKSQEVIPAGRRESRVAPEIRTMSG